MTDAPIDRDTVERFISMYQSGEQGCHMDHDEARAFSKSLRALLAAKEAELEAAVAAEREACASFVAQTSLSFADDVDWFMEDLAKAIRARNNTDALTARKAQETMK